MYKIETEMSPTAFTCIHPIEFFRLKDRKRVYYEENIERRVGMTYYVFSEHSQGWFKRVLTDDIDLIELKMDILLGYVKLDYTPEEQAEIKAIIKRDKLPSYRAFLRMCVGENKQSLIKGTKRNDSQWQTKQNRYTNLRNLSTQS